MNDGIQSSLIKRKKGKRIKSDLVFNIVIYGLSALLLLITLYPVYYVVIASFSDANAVGAGKVILWPVDFTLIAYKELIAYEALWIGYRNTILYTIGYVIASLFVNVTAGFALSRKELPGRKWISKVYMLPMFFGGGMIPTFVIIQKIGLLNNPLSQILPSAVAIYYIIVARTFFTNSIPEELWDASQIDGCGVIQYFVKIVLPLSKAILAVIALWSAVAQWNSYFNAMLYLNDENLGTLQLALRKVLILNDISMGTGGRGFTDRAQLALLLKYASAVVSSAPIMCMYPFVQKYFNQGVMVGSVKG